MSWTWTLPCSPLLVIGPTNKGHQSQTGRGGSLKGVTPLRLRPPHQRSSGFELRGTVLLEGCTMLEAYLGPVVSRRHYRRLARDIHPDKHPENVEEATRRWLAKWVCEIGFGMFGWADFWLIFSCLHAYLLFFLFRFQQVTEAYEVQTFASCFERRFVARCFETLCQLRTEQSVLLSVTAGNCQQAEALNPVMKLKTTQVKSS